MLISSCVQLRQNGLSLLVVLALLATNIMPTLAVDVSSSDKAQAQKIIDATKSTGGLIVHVGCGDGSLTAALQVDGRFQVHGLDRNAANVEQARKHITAVGLYGPVSIDHWQGQRLPYIDNLVNLLVISDGHSVSTEEIQRVLVPDGVAHVTTAGKVVTVTKPRPENIDEWTHYLHDAGGNAVAHDDVVGPPRHLQWLGSPRWSRHHDRMASMSALVSAGGRMFYVMDEGSRVSIQLPPKWTVIARDAFNGTILWKRPIESWQNHLWPLKSGPTQLARRLVATGDRVYVTLGFEAPLTALDAATGETIRTYEDSQSTEEAVLADGVLFLLVNKGRSELADYAPAFNVGDQRRVAQEQEFRWNGKPRQVMAIEADTGKVLWRHESQVIPLSLAANDKHAYFHDGEKVVCLDRASGQLVWSSPPVTRRDAVTMNFGPRLVLYQDVLLFAGGDRKMHAYDAATGKHLWDAPHAQSGYQSPEDLLVSGGLVWVAPTTRTGDTGAFTGRDPRTGEVKSQFSPNVETYWFHHRCYIAKATDKFLIPSRTGVEFVDHQKEDWDIHHWVRGGCLYGIMPCNGLLYAPPHNCACYPEAKLYGFNALAPRSANRTVAPEVEEIGRLTRGPAFEAAITAEAGGETDWPTFRHDAKRSGTTTTQVAANVGPVWDTPLTGRLSSVVVAGGKLFVAAIDEHTVHALSEDTGKPVWSYQAGGRVDSPPVIHQGRVLFGSADGHVYCLRATDGELIWRFRAAPRDERLMAFEQLESVWPVHGTVLVHDGMVYFVAGRSSFLDGGLRMFRLDLITGRKLSESVMGDRDPTTGESLQARIQTLNMPVGLPDILTNDGSYVYMRSQRFDYEGNRQEIGPHSGRPDEQGSEQGGETAHLFSPTGFLDGSWFHRSYFVYGRSFAGGHAGYYQAGKFAPAGRIVVFDDSQVYGYGRKPEYYKWTTTIEHQLFSTSKEAPEVERPNRRGPATGGHASIQIKISKSLNPAGKAISVEAWVHAEKPNGVVIARGGPADGFALIIEGGQPKFVIRAGNQLSSIAAKQRVVGKWVHLAGVLTADKQLELYIDGKIAATGKANAFIASDPKQAMEIGADENSAVGNYRSPFAFTGLIDEVRVYDGALTSEDVKARFSNPDSSAPDKPTAGGAKPVYACSFDFGHAADESSHNNNGKVNRAQPAKGKLGGAMRFVGGKAGGNNGRSVGSYVKHGWNSDIPLFARAMVLTQKTLFVAGPPDLINEEESFQKLMDKDEQVQAALAAQDAALNGNQGILLAVDPTTGKTQAEIKLPGLPVFDGLIAANGRLYVATTDGRVVCLAGE